MLTLGQQIGDPDEYSLPLEDTHPAPCEFLEELDALRCLDTQEMQPVMLSQNADATAKV